MSRILWFHKKRTPNHYYIVKRIFNIVSSNQNNIIWGNALSFHNLYNTEIHNWWSTNIHFLNLLIRVLSKKILSKETCIKPIGFGEWETNWVGQLLWELNKHIKTSIITDCFVNLVELLNPFHSDKLRWIQKATY